MKRFTFCLEMVDVCFEIVIYLRTALYANEKSLIERFHRKTRSFDWIGFIHSKQCTDESIILLK